MSEDPPKYYDIPQSNLELAAELVEAADALVITAGAGMGVDSGLPDFRGNKGFWKAYPTAEKLGLSFSDLANPLWFQRNPRLAWAFYGQRLSLYRTTTPHSGFQQLLKLGESKKYGYFVFTSNVDGQFQKAGFDGERIVECHGSIHHLQCADHCWDSIWPATSISITIEEEKFRAVGDLPGCSNCGGLARPNILMFNDNDWIDRRNAEQNLRLFSWWQGVVTNHQKVVVIELGAGTAIPTVRRKSESLAASYDKATLIRINPREFQVPDGNLALAFGAAEGVDRICQLL